MIWTTSELNLLRKTWPTDEPIEKIRRLLSRHTPGAIESKVRMLRLHRPTSWLPEEIELLRETYLVKSIRELKELFPRHPLPSIRNKALALGMRRTNRWAAIAGTHEFQLHEFKFEFRSPGQG